MTNDAGAGRVVEVRANKYDGRVHRRWPARVARREGPLVVLDAVFEEEIRHPLLGTIVRGTISTEYYWTDRWYNVFRFLEPSGALRNFYCNVNSPAEYDGETLTFTDFDIDVLVRPDFSFTILDEDEFAVNAARFDYPSEIFRRVREALAELVALIEARDFPFDASPG